MPPRSATSRRRSRSDKSTPNASLLSNRTADRNLGEIGPQRLQQPFGETGGVEDGADEDEHAMGVGVQGQFHQRVADVAKPGEALGAADQPKIEVVLERANVGGQLGVEA